MSLPVQPPLTPIRQVSRGAGFAASLDASSSSAAADLSAPLPLFAAPARQRSDDATQTDEDAQTNFDEELEAARTNTIPKRKNSSDAAAAAVVAAAQLPPLSPSAAAAAAQRKRAFEPADAAAAAATATGATGEETLAASASARSPSPAAAAVAAAAAAAPSSSGVAAASSSPSSSSRVSWPYYLVTAVAGAPNLAYASFVPRSKTFPKSPYSPAFDFDDDLADAADWWGSGSGGGSAAAENEASSGGDAQKQAATEEQKQAGAGGMIEDDAQTSKRARIASAAAGPNCTTTPPRVSPRSLTTATAAPPPAIPVDPLGVNVLSSYGQDSHFSLSNRALGCCVLGVADGVGGWRDNGVDSGEISRAMMKACRDIAIKQSWRAARGAAATPISRRTSPQMQQQPQQTSPAAAAAAQSSAPFTLSPSDVLTRAYAQVKGSGEVEAGSTTACIVALTRVPITALAEFDAHRDLEQRRIIAAETSAAAAAAAAAAASAPRAIAPSSGSMSSTAASFMSDIVSAVSLQSEQLVAAVLGREMQPSVSSLASDSFTSMSDAEAEAEAENDSAAGKENVNHATSAPIAIPPQQQQQQQQQPPSSSPVMITIADSSPEPINVLPSAPPAASAAVAMEAEVPSNAASAAAAVAPAAPSSASDEIYISAANLGDSGYIIFRREYGTTGNYRVVTASDLQRAGRTVKQLAIIPSEYEHQQYCDDSPAEAMLDAHRVQAGDLIVLASDGLWDNLIASEWQYSFLYGWRQKEDLSPTSRKDRMCLVLEQIVATGATKAAEMRLAARLQAARLQVEEAQAQAQAQAEMTDAASAGDKSAVSAACDELKEVEAPVSGRSAGSAPSSTASTSTSASAFISACGSMAGSRCASTSALSSVLLESAPTTARGEEAMVVGEGLMLGDATMSDDSGGLAMGNIIAMAARSSSPPADTSLCVGAFAAPSLSAVERAAAAALNWDQVEVDLVAEALKDFALRFMGSPDGKPDDLSIIAAKIMKEEDPAAQTK